ncbi:MAG: hypothetical protein Q8S17_02540, partial [Humidesulfovibrio sp.]|nr:hypothetical protein [Humidesulfovibrio sp.]
MSLSAVEIAEALRRFARSERDDALKALPAILSELSELPAGHGDTPQGAAVAGEIACLLFGIVRPLRDVALMSRTLQSLSSLGRFGRSLLMSYIQARNIALPQITPILQALPGGEFLALVNEMLLAPLGDDKQYMAWLKGLLPVPGRCDPRASLLFLRALDDEGTPLAKPLREALLAACLAEALPKVFAGKPAAATSEAMLKSAESLSSPAIHVEALGYALRVSGTSGPSRLAPLLAAAPDMEVREPALLAEMRRLAVLPSAPALLLPAAQAEPELLGLVLADMLRQGGETRERALRLSPLLPRTGLAP